MRRFCSSPASAVTMAPDCAAGLDHDDGARQPEISRLRRENDPACGRPPADARSRAPCLTIRAYNAPFAADR